MVIPTPQHTTQAILRNDSTSCGTFWHQPTPPAWSSTIRYGIRREAYLSSGVRFGGNSNLGTIFVLINHRVQHLPHPPSKYKDDTSQTHLIHINEVTVTQC